MMLMQEPSDREFELIIPRKHLQKLEEYRRKRATTLEKPRMLGINRPNVFSSRCKQAVSISNKVYCAVLKDSVQRAVCKSCPCHEPEPLDYSLFRRE